MSLPPPRPPQPLQPSYAVHKFFSVGDLVFFLCSFLTTNQVLMLIQTNKHLHDIAAPFLWRNVDFCADDRVEMLYRLDGRELLSKVSYCININKIRSLKAGFAFMSYYLEGVRQHLDKDNTQQQDMPPYEWIPAHQLALFSAPLPLIKKLNQLDVSLLQKHRFSEAFFAGLNKAPPLAPRLLRLMALNADDLTFVSLQHFSIADVIDFRRLCWTINNLKVLAHLVIDIPVKEDGRLLEHPFSIITALFFSCRPSSLISFSMTTTVRDNKEGENEDYFRMPREDSDPVAAAKPTHEPFKNLKYLKLPQHKTGYTQEQLKSILSQCSALEEWVNIPSSFKRSGEPSQVGDDRLEYPSALMSLSTHPVKTCKGEVVADIMDTIKGDQLKFFDFHLFEDRPPNRPDLPAPFVGSLLRHANSLVSISLIDINWIQSKSIKFILTTCAALRTLVFASYNTMRSCLTLEDATIERWACTDLKELRLIVNLNRGSANQYNMLEKLYAQIGALKRLEILDLMSARNASKHDTDTTMTCMLALRNKTANRHRNASKHYTDTTMTCMLALRNKTANRQGFLQSLAELKNLRVLLGSLHLGMHLMVEEAEVKWILENWPCLETIEFISESVRRLGPAHWPPQIELLKRGRPNLQFCRT